MEPAGEASMRHACLIPYENPSSISDPLVVMHLVFVVRHEGQYKSNMTSQNITLDLDPNKQSWVPADLQICSQHKSTINIKLASGELDRWKCNEKSAYTAALVAQSKLKHGKVLT